MNTRRIITLRNKFHHSSRSFRLTPATDGDFGRACYLSRRSSRAWLCNHESCKCSLTITCTTEGYRFLGVDQDGRVAVAPEVACNECSHRGAQEPLDE